AVGAIVVLLVANYFLKSAKVTLYAKGTKVDVNFGFSVDPKAGQSNYDKALLVGRELASAKELTATAAATGKKDVGTKAKGEMVVTNRTGAAQVLVAGTRFQAGDKLFRSDADVTVPGATVDGNGNVVPGKASVQVTAETAGDQFNLAPTRYTIPALAADKQDKIFGDGRQMAGGTSKQVAVVTQADIDKARVEALAKDKEAAQKDLDNKVPAGFRLIPESFSQTAGEVKASPGVDAEASQTSVTVAVNYSQLAVAEADFDQLLRAQEQKQIGADNQIYDSGASEAKISAGPREEGGRQRFTLVTAAYGGAKLDTGEIAEQIKGKKYGEAAEMTAKLPGIERSEISLSPVWSAKLPRLSKNIKIEVKVENAKG
ncbi:MAG TPA: hypothetical protein VK963_02680, partial [Candidatus Saccharimonadales bacterium]|nr:hypothetical protein [Candidatus Saccharimonadales bacterium]